MISVIKIKKLNNKNRFVAPLILSTTPKRFSLTLYSQDRLENANKPFIQFFINELCIEKPPNETTQLFIIGYSVGPTSICFGNLEFK